MAYFLNGVGNDDPSSIMGWVSTGCSTLDLAISNVPNGVPTMFGSYSSNFNQIEEWIDSNNNSPSDL